MWIIHIIKLGHLKWNGWEYNFLFSSWRGSLFGIFLVCFCVSLVYILYLVRRWYSLYSMIFGHLAYLKCLWQLSLYVYPNFSIYLTPHIIYASLLITSQLITFIISNFLYFSLMYISTYIGLSTKRFLIFLYKNVLWISN
jgi:hypothetical protein